MALTRGLPLFARTRFQVYGPDTTTTRGDPIVGSGCSATHSKAFSESGATLSVSTLEAALGADQSMLSDAFLVPEVYYETSSAYIPFGTPYMLSPGTGEVIGTDPAPVQSPVAVGALQGMLDTLEVFPTEVDTDHGTFRKAGGLEQNRYFNCFSKGYSESLHSGEWFDADEYDPSGKPKEHKPTGWPAWAAAAKFVYNAGGDGGRTCVRADTFTLEADQRVEIIAVSDENHKFFLDGPNQGGVVIDWTADEDGYNQGWGQWKGRLKAGTYRPGAWFLTVNSTGGDGNDSIRFAARSIATDGSGDTDAVLFVSDSSCRVLRRAMSEPIPGMSIGEVIRRALNECETVADGDDNYATLLLSLRTFNDSTNTNDNPWTHLKEWVWPHRTSLASAFSDLLTDCDLDMGPDFSFNGYNDRGSDLSGSVVLQPGQNPPTAADNVLTYDYDSDPPGPNAYALDTQDGQTVYIGTLPSGDFRRFGSLDSGSAGSVAQGKTLAAKAVADTGKTRRYYHAQILAVDGAVPYVDFNLCDVIAGRDYVNAEMDLEVTAMTWDQGDTTLLTLDLAKPEA